MKLEDAIKLGLGLKGIITHASTVTMQEALTTMATELELLRTQEPVAVVERVHGQVFVQFANGKTLYDMPVGMQLFAHPMVALKHSHEKLKIKDDLIASLEAQCKELEQKLAATEQRPQPVGVELVHPKFPPVRHGVGDIVESDYPFDGATTQNVKPTRFVETNQHEIDLKRVQCISRPNEKGRYFVTLVSGIDLPVEDNLYPHAVLSAQWKAYGEAN